MNRRLRAPTTRGLAIGVVACFVALYLLLLGDRGFVEDRVESETGLVQSAGALALLGASILFGLAFARTRRLAFLILALGFFVGAGEEASWGQFALGYDPPQTIKDANAQDEVTLHNLNFIQDARHAVGFDLVLAGFIALALGFTLLVPLLARRSAGARAWLERRLPIVPVIFGALLVLNLALFALAGILSGADRAHAVTEIAEAGLSFLFLAIAADAAARAHRPSLSQDTV